MDKDRIEGSANQAKGAIKQAAGKLTGDAKLKAEGAADKAKGKVQNAIGGAKDALRDASQALNLKHDRESPACRGKAGFSHSGFGLSCRQGARYKDACAEDFSMTAFCIGSARSWRRF